MPYDTPPAKVKGLPEHAQKIWVSAYNSAYKQYKEDEAKANATAWAAVKSAGYSQDKEGRWHKTGKIIQKNDKARYTLGVVYEPDSLDTDNEFTTADELEKACWGFMRDLQGAGDLAKAAVALISEIHKAVEDGDEVSLEIDEAFDEIGKRGVNAMHLEDLDGSHVVECYIAPADMVVNGEAVKKGSWMAGIVWDPDSFAKIQSGEWTGYSMGGLTRKIDV